jgi:ABC-type branched-subunit amino acid transport system ATPase component
MTIAERLTVFHLGQVVADGEPEAVLKDPFVRQVYIG